MENSKFPITLYYESHYHVEFSLLVSKANQCSDFHIIGTYVVKELNKDVLSQY